MVTTYLKQEKDGSVSEVIMTHDWSAKVVDSNDRVWPVASCFNDAQGCLRAVENWLSVNPDIEVNDIVLTREEIV